MTGKEAIVAKIISDARIIANSTLEEASNRGKEILLVAENDARIYREKNMAESIAEREEIIRRKITVANLEVKKMILQTRQKLMAEAFEKAIEAIKEDTSAYLALLDGMLSYASDGDEVVLSEDDKKLVNAKWLSGKAADKGKKFRFGGYAPFRGGMIIKGEGSDKNLTLEVEMKAVKERYEPVIAELLFGE